MADGENNLTVSGLSVNFEMANVSGTNVYIIIRDAWHTGGTKCDCNVNEVSLILNLAIHTCII